LCSILTQACNTFITLGQEDFAVVLTLLLRCHPKLVFSEGLPEWRDKFAEIDQVFLHGSIQLKKELSSVAHGQFENPVSTNIMFL
jgi:hypothetical protein